MPILIPPASGLAGISCANARRKVEATPPIVPKAAAPASTCRLVVFNAMEAPSVSVLSNEGASVLIAPARVNDPSRLCRRTIWFNRIQEVGKRVGCPFHRLAAHHRGNAQPDRR